MEDMDEEISGGFAADAERFDPVAYINEPRWQQVKPGLERIRVLLDGLGNPQKSLRFIHVAGTNGKGSTCVLMASALQQAGYRTGLFTSPYIFRFEERIRVNGEPILLPELTQVTLQVREVAEQMPEHPTEFELMTAVAFVYFAQSNCDIVVAEVGLGGRLDSTNIIECPEVSVIASISFDHCAVLGSSLSEIATEKAGIIKQGAPVVSAAQKRNARMVLDQVAKDNNTSVAYVDNDAIVGTNDAFSYKGFNNLSLTLVAPYQKQNAALALEALWALRSNGWSISDEAIRAGFAHAQWPGRFQIFRAEGMPTAIVDGGHNTQGAQALVSSLETIFPGVRPIFVVGLLADKDYSGIIAELGKIASAFIAIEPPNPRALPAAELAAEIQVEMHNIKARHNTQNRAAHANSDAVQDADRYDVSIFVADSIDDGVACAFEYAAPYEVICCCGSLYSIGAVTRAVEKCLQG